jgi:precorrin-6B methylase 2
MHLPFTKKNLRVLSLAAVDTHANSAAVDTDVNAAAVGTDDNAAAVDTDVNAAAVDTDADAAAVHTDVCANAAQLNAFERTRIYLCAWYSPASFSKGICLRDSV